MDCNNEIFNCIIIFNRQHEPILSLYDDYFYKQVILPSKLRFEQGMENISIENVLMQLFSPIIASQSAMIDTMKTMFTTIDLYSNQTLIFRKMYNCSIIVMLTEKCLFRQHSSIINKKIELIDWLISSFYGICWHQMKFNNDRWLKILLKEMWLMDNNEFNLMFGSIERIDLSSQLKLNEHVLEVLVSNSRYLRQVNEKRLKHQLILVGSKLFSLYTSNESLNNLKAKDNLLFVLISNAVFNRFSRARESPIVDTNFTSKTRKDKTLIRSISEVQERETKVSSSSSNDEFSSAESNADQFLEIVRTSSNTMKLSDSLRENSLFNSSTSSITDYDPFVVWIENKDGHRYRIVRIFIKTSNGILTPCHLHLLKLARNVIYIGVEEDLDNNIFIQTLDKSIRSLRSIMPDCDKGSDLISILKTRIGQAVDKLHYLGAIHSQQLRQTFRRVLSRNITNPDFLERLIKELLNTFEVIYCKYFLISPININEKLCKSFLRCFLSVKKEMADFLSILSMKALRNMSPTSFYPLYPGMVHFIIRAHRLHNSLICPVIDHEFLTGEQVQRLHIMVDMCQKLGVQLDTSKTWRQIEICDTNFRCTYQKRKYKTLEDKYNEFEFAVFHLAEVSYSLVKKQIKLLINQFLEDHRGTATPLLD